MRYDTNRHTQPATRAERPLISNPIRPAPGSTPTIHVPWTLAALVIMLALPVRGASATTTTLTEYPLSASNSGPTSIATGPDGNLWFTEVSGNKIGQITPAGTIHEFAVPTANSAPLEITAGPDGNLWFTEFGNTIGRVSRAGVISEFFLPTASGGFPDGHGITAGPDGNLWFTSGNKIGRIRIPGPVLGDVDGDGKADLVWRHTQTGDVAVWLMNSRIGRGVERLR